MPTVNVTAVGSMAFSGLAHAYSSPIKVTAKSAMKFSGVAHSGSARTVSVTAAGNMAFAGAGSIAVAHVLNVTASGRMAFSGAEVLVATRTIPVTASGHMAFSGAEVVAASKTYSVTASGSMAFVTSGHWSSSRTVPVTASGGMAFSGLANARKRIGVTAVGSMAFAGAETLAKTVGVTATGGMGFSGVAHASKVTLVTATGSMAFSGVAHTGGIINVTATGSMAFSGVAHASIGRSVSGSMAFSGVASCTITLANGTTLPGGDANAGLTAVLMNGVSGDYPFTAALMPGGMTLLSNGIDPMVRWDTVAGTMTTAGCSAPSTAIALGGTGTGTITGERIAYQRFIDISGNVSNLSPVSNIVVMGREGIIDDIQCNPGSGVVTIRSDGHGLITGEQIVLRGIQGVPLVNGTWTIAVTTANHFTINSLVETSNTWLQGGSWVWGVASVSYSSVVGPASTVVARRQILRNLEGSLDTLYVDIDTADLTSTSFSSTRDDESLASQEPVPIADSENLPFANRYGVPPSHKAYVVAHAGRVFAAGDVPYSTGCVSPSPGRNTIQGIGTSWRANFVGRVLNIQGADTTLTITAVDVVNQIITYSGTLAKANLPFATYTIRPPRGESKLVYYSEAGNGEAWPEWNTVGIPDDGDSIVGMFVAGSYLYVVEQRHVYRLVFGGIPATTGAIYLSCRRGAVNGRCVVQAEDRIFMLDEQGIHSYDFDNEDKNVSNSIQTVFHNDGTSSDLQVDWTADRTLWHACYDPARETIRWFVAMVGDTDIFHAICYHHRLDRWWIEQYPVAITSSGTMDVGGYRRAVVGTETRRVLVLNEGCLDIVPATGTLRGVVTSATASTLTDSLATFANNLAGVPVSIVGGTGKGQQGIVSSNTATTLTMVQNWVTTPDTTSTYQVGGVNWAWQSGWFQLSSDQTGNPRDVAVVYKPLVNPTTLDMSVFYDHAASPRTWAYAQADDGVSIQANSPYITVDMTRTVRPGWAMKRMEGHNDVQAYGDLHISLGLSGVQATENVRLSHVFVTGAEHQGEYQPGGPQ